MLSFQHTKAAVVQTLFATSVVLSLAVALVLGEKVSKKTFVWSLTALIGVSILVIA
jgi:drug/metabolite transporter (DMT)-like permease